MYHNNMYPTKKYPHTERFQPPILSIPKMHSKNKNYSIFYIGFVYSNCSEPLVILVEALGPPVPPGPSHTLP